MRTKILIVDDEKNTREGVARFLRTKDFDCELADNGKTALEILNSFKIDIVLTDLRMPAMGGMELIKKIKEISKEITVIVLTAYGSVETAVEALKRGADDFLTKPINLEKLYITITRITKTISLEQENKQLKRQLDDKFGLEKIIGNSNAIQKVFDVVKQVAPSRASILIQGESGTGKELIAQAIHGLSTRSSYPFVPVHCASLADNLLESELFGHEKGAFTGAIAQKIGRFEQANHGSLFLDEVGEISMAVQVKLLRVLQEQVFERVGGTQTIKTDIRLIAATNKSLDDEVKNNSFREDLFYRLNVVTINLPPLRDRQEDIPLLIDHYLKKFRKENNKSSLEIDKNAIKVLQKYLWPGNIRELRNCIENMVVLAKTDVLSADDIPEKIVFSLQSNVNLLNPGSNSKLNIKNREKELIIKALDETKNNRSKAAEILGLSRRTLYRKLQKYGLE